MTSNAVITEKYEKLCYTAGILGIQGAFSGKVTPDIDGCIEEPAVQYDV